MSIPEEEIPNLSQSDSNEVLKTDFDFPQKQSAIGIVVLFVHSLQKIIRAIAIPAFVFFVKTDTQTSYTLIGAAILLFVVGLGAFLRYKNFTFFLDEAKQEFIINHGIFNKKTLIIQLDKIQQVNINQSLIQRLVGVYSLEIDTAGSDKKEGSIKAISKQTAEVLRKKLLNVQVRKSKIQNQDLVDETRNEPFLKLSQLTLLKIGITSNYGQTIALVMGVLAAGYQNFKDLDGVIEIDKDKVGDAINQSWNPVVIAIICFVCLVILLIINIIRTYITYFDFEIFKKNYSLTIKSGLFSKKNTLLNPDKVQLSGYTQNYFQKKIQITNMRMRQNAAAIYDGNEVKKNEIVIPGCCEDERDEILRMIFNELPEKGTAVIPNYRYIYKGVLFFILIPIAAFVSIHLSFYQELISFYPLLFCYVLIIVLMLFFSYKNYRLFVSDGYIIKRSGIWDIEHQIIEPYKIQAITTSQMLWHKKANIGNITCHTAAGDISFRFGNYTKIRQMMNFWLYQVESSKKEWM